MSEPIDYRAAWQSGALARQCGRPLDTCPFTNAGEAKMWRAGWYYFHVHYTCGDKL